MDRVVRVQQRGHGDGFRAGRVLDHRGRDVGRVQCGWIGIDGARGRNILRVHPRHVSNHRHGPGHRGVRHDGVCHHPQFTFISGLSLGGVALVAVGSAAVAYTGYKLYEWATSPAQKRYVRRRQLLLMAGGSIVYMNGWRETTVHAYDNPAITSLGYVNADGRVMLATLPPGTLFHEKQPPGRRHGARLLRPRHALPRRRR